MKLRFVLALAGLAGALAMLSSACGGSSGGDGDVITAITYMDGAGLHDIHETIANTGKIPANAQTVATHLQAVTLLTEWPADLKDDAKALAALFGAMAKALDSATPDMAAAEAATGKAHDGWHDFSHEVWEHLAKEAKIGDAHGAEEHD